MNAGIQIITAFLGALGFGVLYHIKGYKLVVVGAGGMLSWMVYLGVHATYDDKILSLFASTIAVGITSEILARVIKTPVTILMVPMLIPLVPGSDLFYATSNLMLNDLEAFSFYLNLVLKEAAAIAFGIILVACLIQLLQPLLHPNKNCT